MALAGKDARVLTSGGSESMSNESMSDNGDGVTFVIDDSSKNAWDPSATFSFSDGNSNTLSPSNYTIKYGVGAVEFDSTPTTPVTLDTGAYFPLYEILEGFSHDLTFERDLQETTRFQDEGARRQISVLDVSGAFSLNAPLEQPLDGAAGSEPSLREILLAEETHGNTGTVDTPFLLRYDPDGLETTIVSVWVKMENEEFSASTGSKQERNYSLQGAVQTAAMSTQRVQLAQVLET